MKIQTIKKLQRLLGSVCSILTTNVAKTNFSDIQFADFFVGILEEISEDGVWIKHSMTGCLSFFPIAHVVGILQEQVIDQDNPEYEKILSEIKKAPPEQQANIVPVNPNTSTILDSSYNGSPYVDPEVLASLSLQASEIQKKMISKN